MSPEITAVKRCCAMEGPKPSRCGAKWTAARMKTLCSFTPKSLLESWECDAFCAVEISGMFNNNTTCFYSVVIVRLI